MNDMIDVISDFLNYTLKRIVDNKECVTIKTSVTTSNLVIFQISVKKEDRGKVIGKNGKTIESIKTLSLAIKNTLGVHDRVPAGERDEFAHADPRGTGSQRE